MMTIKTNHVGAN